VCHSGDPVTCRDDDLLFAALCAVRRPVQRLPRYLLLLTTIKQFMDPSDAQLSDVCAALDTVKSVTTDINDRLKSDAMRRRVVSIQGHLEQDDRYVDLVTPGRYFVREGTQLTTHDT
jgi:hypothetical protein